MNRYEHYLNLTPILTSEDLVGYWCHLQDIVDGLVLPLLPEEIEEDNDRDEDEEPTNWTEATKEWARRQLTYGHVYLIIQQGGWDDEDIEHETQRHPPKWSSKHVSKHPKWGKHRYE